MFVVIHTGGKQHRVADNDRILVERLEAEPGDVVAFDRVLMVAEDGKEPLVGDAVPREVRVFGRVLEQTRGPKLVIFKKKRRKNHRRTRGHRQHLTAIRILSISQDGTFEEEAAAEPVPAVQAEAATASEAVIATEGEPVLQE
jgi:large subunit ribosomal protein L21